MGRFLLCLFIYLAVFCFGQSEVGPDSYFPYMVLAIVLIVPVLFFLIAGGLKKQVINIKDLFVRGRLVTKLVPNPKYQPSSLTFIVRNKLGRGIDLEAPVLIFRKLWSVRKFKLKGINRAEIYPLYLESGEKHELQLKLDVFHKHDPGLRSYYWVRVLIKDTTGKTYTTNHISLHKNFFS